MIDIELFRHEKEQKAFENMLKENLAFEGEIGHHFEDYVKPTRMPDLYGKTVTVTSKQFANIYHMSKKIAVHLDMDAPEIFVYESFYYTVEAKGTLSNWIEISAKTVADLNDDELLFLLAKEMCAIKLEHTRYQTILHEFLKIDFRIPFSDKVQEIKKLTMYHWVRLTSFTSDNFAYLACGDIGKCIRAILSTVLNDVYLAKNVDLQEFIRQGEKINALQTDAHKLTKMDELVPYAPFRIKNLIAYAASSRGLSAKAAFSKQGVV